MIFTPDIKSKNIDQKKKTGKQSKFFVPNFQVDLKIFLNNTLLKQHYI